jgi:hypothetical protein
MTYNKRNYTSHTKPYSKTVKNANKFQELFLEYPWSLLQGVGGAQVQQKHLWALLCGGARLDRVHPPGGLPDVVPSVPEVDALPHEGPRHDWEIAGAKDPVAICLPLGVAPLCTYASRCGSRYQRQIISTKSLPRNFLGMPFSFDC